MERIHTKESFRTPGVDFNSTRDHIKIWGKSIPEDAWTFYQPLVEWVENYVVSAAFTKTTIEISLEYSNSTSTKFVFQILKTLDTAAAKGHKVVLRWHYADQDDDMEELGQDFAQMLNSIHTELVPHTTPYSLS